MEVDYMKLVATLFLFFFIDFTCSTPREEVHLIGSNVVLQCDRIGQNIQWVCPVKDNLSCSKSSCDSKYFGGRLFQENNVLRIVNAQKSDEGLYKCLNETSNGEIQFILTFPALLSSTEPSYYRNLMVDTESKTLIVGYMNHISLISLPTDPVSPSMLINTTIEPDLSKVNTCRLSKPVRPDCQNHMKILAKKTNDIFIVCGTNAYTPTGYEFNITDGSYVETGSVPCSNDPFHNSTTILVETNNPDNNSHMYYGSVYYSDKTIQRPNYDTDGTIKDYIKGVDSTNWMKDPQFVFSYELKDEVLLFFRETAVEVDPNYPKTFSRVAKVCKKDLGGNTQLRNKWTSFQKARINCQTSGPSPHVFDLLQDVVEINDTLYGLFTSGPGLPSSAICTLNVSSITQAFIGQFRHQPSAGSFWVPVATGDVPFPRPGECTNDSLALPDTTLEFIANYPLLDTVINGRATFVMQGEELQKLEQHHNMSDIVLYAGSNRGNVYKLFIRDSETFILNNYTIEDGSGQSNVIWSMKQFGENLFVGTDNFVQQITVINCEQYKWIDSCITDPHCVWINDTSLIEDINLLSNHLYFKGCRSHSYLAKNHTEESNKRITHEDVTLPIRIPVKTPPDKPTSLRSVDATDKTILLEWIPGFCGGHHQEFIIFLNGSALSQSVNETRHTVSNLDPGEKYEFKLMATNAIGNSSFTESILVYTGVANADETPTTQVSAIEHDDRSKTSPTLTSTTENGDKSKTSQTLTSTTENGDKSKTSQTLTSTTENGDKSKTSPTQTSTTENDDKSDIHASNEASMTKNDGRPTDLIIGLTVYFVCLICLLLLAIVVAIKIKNEQDKEKKKAKKYLS